MNVFDKGFTLTWLGHATFELVTPGGKHLLVDPWLEGNPMTPVGGPPLAQVDAILVTHAHGDHTRDVVRLWQKFRCPVVCIHEASMYFEKQGVANVLGMGKGGTAAVAGVRVTMTHAVHSSSFDTMPEPPYGGEPAGYVVTLENGAKVYFAGDTGPTMDMQIVGDLYTPDVAVLPIGDHYTMGPREAAYVAKLIRAKWIVPAHYGTFPLLSGTPEALRAELKARGVDAEVVAPKPGEPVS